MVDGERGGCSIGVADVHFWVGDVEASGSAKEGRVDGEGLDVVAGFLVFGCL